MMIFRRGAALCFCLLAITLSALGQSLPVQWEELTAEDFVHAIAKAEGVCVLPDGILEKHGPHLPIGTDLLNVRYAAIHAAEKEYAVVFPAYYAGQIFEAKHQPGTIAYSADLQLKLLQETTDEMARNGCKKIIIANGHGGSIALEHYFAQIQLAKQHDYVVYIYPEPDENQPGRPKLKSNFGGHADEAETAEVMISRPDLVHMDRVGSESGADLKRLDLPHHLFTGISWYASFPNHYAGEASGASRELGQFDMNVWVTDFAESIRSVKNDDASLRLQKEFFEKSARPLDTRQ